MKDERFGKMSIEALEVIVVAKNQESRVAQQEMIEVLFYLRRTGRFKENLRYAKSDFFTYIEDRFTIRKNTYMDAVYAYSRYPQETREYGVGLVAKITRVCGTRQTGKVLNKLADAKAAAARVLSRAKIEKIIQAYAIPRPPKQSPVDLRAKYDMLEKAHELLKLKYKEALAANRELTAQIAKLKQTAERITAIRAIVEPVENRFVVGG